MQLRFPEGFRSNVDTDLVLRGPPDRPVLAGTVNVRDAVLLGGFDEVAVGLLGGGDADGGATVETGTAVCASTSGSRRPPPCA